MTAQPIQGHAVEDLCYQLDVHPNSIREMKWMREQPEVIKYLKENYNEEELPPWVGTLGGTPPEGTTPLTRTSPPWGMGPPLMTRVPPLLRMM